MKDFSGSTDTQEEPSVTVKLQPVQQVIVQQVHVVYFQPVDINLRLAAKVSREVGCFLVCGGA